MWDAKLPQNRHDDAVNVPARDGWEKQVAGLDTSPGEGPEGAYEAERRGVFRPDRSETRSAANTAVRDVLYDAEFHHEISVAVQGG